MRYLATLCVLLGLTACGGDPTPPDLDGLASDLGCQHLKHGQQMLTREMGSCRLDGEDVYLQTFSSTEQQDQWMSVGADLGGGVLARGDLWVAQTFNAQVASTVASRLGGDVVR